MWKAAVRSKHESKRGISISTKKITREDGGERTYHEALLVTMRLVKATARMQLIF